MRIRTFLLLLLAALTACTTLPEGQRSTKPASGPPEVEGVTVERHAVQFDEEEPVRLAGSQQELAASAYIVAHLTEAGYVSRLDAVPVQDLVRSTNVVALPPSGKEPTTLVAVAYDSTEDSRPSGLSIGVFLEVARALRAVEPDHAVEFVALGAENTDVNGGRLGSRRLVNEFLDSAPEVIVVHDVGRGPFRAFGYAERELEAEALKAGATLGEPLPGWDEGLAFRKAGLDTSGVSGPPEAVGPALLGYLSGL